MRLIDWLIIICVTSFVAYIAFKTKKYTKSVADFLAANRCAGKYLLGIASGEAALAAVSFIVYFEIFYQTGFTKIYWDSVGIPLALLVFHFTDKVW